MGPVCSGHEEDCELHLARQCNVTLMHPQPTAPQPVAAQPAYLHRLAWTSLGKKRAPSSPLGPS